MDSQNYELNFQSAIGQKLKNAREKKNFSQREVANALNLTTKVIDALEREDYLSLPGSVFVKGYIRSYAQFLNLVEPSITSQINFIKVHSHIKPYQKISQAKLWTTYWIKMIHQSFNYIALILFGVVIFIAWHERHHDIQKNQSDLLFKNLAAQMIPFQKKSEEIAPDINNSELLKQIQPWKSP
jgi:cytoskeletal protein RodZ